MLISVNPFKRLPSCAPRHLAALAGASQRSELRASVSIADEANEPPHIFCTVRNAYRALRRGGVGARSQAIVINGESGAGKTEATKLALHCLALLSGSEGASTRAVLESGRLLEAFGNAKTIHNHNSSRFGKWVELRFDAAGRIGACSLQSYLLERSRVAQHAAGERNYHAFYYLLRGAPPQVRRQHQLPVVADVHRYAYAVGGTLGAAVAAAQTPAALAEEAANDECGWTEVQEHLRHVGLPETEAHELFGLIAAVLEVGNITFVGPPGGGGGDAQGGSQAVEDKTHLLKVAGLLQLGAGGAPALEKALTTKPFASGRGSTYAVTLTPRQCADTRDALAKAVYGKLFLWLVGRVNQLMPQPPTAAFSSLHESSGGGDDDRSVGVLDIFGFENLAQNSFEQLCINYANEKLQLMFVQHLGARREAELAAEGIDFVPSTFPDNASQVSMLEAPIGKGAAGGILSLINEECMAPRTDDRSLVDKLHKAFGPQARGRSALFIMPKGGKGVRDAAAIERLRLQFGVRHYGGDVMYTAESWLDKNRGHLPHELGLMLLSSGSRLLADLFGESDSAKESMTESDDGPAPLTTHSTPLASPRGLDRSRSSFAARGLASMARARGAGAASAKALAAAPAASPARGEQQGRGKAVKTGALQLATFRASLTELMASLEATSVQYVRCIKPNPEQAAESFNGRFVERQLKYTGVVAAVEMLRASYQSAVDKQEFVSHYGRALAFAEKMLRAEPPPAGQLDALVTQMLSVAQRVVEPTDKWTPWLEARAVQLGRTKVFLKEEVVRQLEHARELALQMAAATVQRVGRTRLAARTAAALQMIRQHERACASHCDSLELEAAKGTLAALDEARRDARGLTFMSVALAAKLEADLAHFQAQVSGAAERREQMQQQQQQRGRRELDDAKVRARLEAKERAEARKGAEETARCETEDTARGAERRQAAEEEAQKERQASEAVCRAEQEEAEAAVKVAAKAEAATRAAKAADAKAKARAQREVDVMAEEKARRHAERRVAAAKWSGPSKRVGVAALASVPASALASARAAGDARRRRASIERLAAEEEALWREAEELALGMGLRVDELAAEAERIAATEEAGAAEAEAAFEQQSGEEPGAPAEEKKQGRRVRTDTKLSELDAIAPRPRVEGEGDDDDDDDGDSTSAVAGLQRWPTEEMDEYVLGLEKRLAQRDEDVVELRRRQLDERREALAKREARLGALHSNGAAIDGGEPRDDEKRRLVAPLPLPIPRLSPPPHPDDASAASLAQLPACSQPIPPALMEQQLGPPQHSQVHSQPPALPKSQQPKRMLRTPPKVRPPPAPSPPQPVPSVPAAPEPLRGPLYKLSPRSSAVATLYQRRTITVKSGLFAYVTGKSEIRSFPLSDVAEVASERQRHMFLVRLSSGREYIFKVDGKAAAASRISPATLGSSPADAELMYWLDGLHAHLEYYGRPHASSTKGDRTEPQSMANAAPIFHQTSSAHLTVVGDQAIASVAVAAHSAASNRNDTAAAFARATQARRASSSLWSLGGSSSSSLSSTNSLLGNGGVQQFSRAASLDDANGGASGSGAPPPIAGRLFKRSPRGPIYQERSVTIKEGRLEYVGGNGSLHKVPLDEISRVALTSGTKCEFTVSVVGTPPMQAPRDYAFRAADSVALDDWIQGLKAHMLHENQRAATGGMGSVAKTERPRSALTSVKRTVTSQPPRCDKTQIPVDPQTHQAAAEAADSVAPAAGSANLRMRAKGQKSPLPVGWPPEAELEVDIDEMDIDEMAFWGDSPHSCDQQHPHSFEAVPEDLDLLEGEVENLSALSAASSHSHLLHV